MFRGGVATLSFRVRPFFVLSFLSEFTFSSGACKEGTMNWYPRVADGLLYAVLHGKVPASAATPDFIEKTVTNKSWVLLPPKNTSNFSTSDTFATAARAYPSPVDLCETSFPDSEVLRKSCYDAARKVKYSLLRCFDLDAAGLSVRSAGASPYDHSDQDNNVFECTKALHGKLA